MTYDGTDPDDDGVVESDVDNQSTTTQSLETDSLPNIADHIVSSKSELQSAITNLSQGDTVWIETPDTPYRTDQWLDIEVGGVTIAAQSGYARNGEPLIKVADGANVGGIRVGYETASQVNDVKIENVAFHGNYQNQDQAVKKLHAILVENAENVDLVNCHFRDTSPQNEHDSGGCGISVQERARDVTIRDCRTIANIGDRAVEIAGERVLVDNLVTYNSYDRSVALDVINAHDGNNYLSRNVTVKNCTLGQTEDGSAIGAGQAQTFPNIRPNRGKYVISNNRIRGKFANGVVLKFVGDIVVSGNIIHMEDGISSRTASGIDIKEGQSGEVIPHPIISNNYISGFQLHGIIVYRSDVKPIVYGNTVEQCDDHGINIGVGGYVYNNTSSYNGKSGIRVAGGDAQIVGNAAEENDQHGIFDESGSAGNSRLIAANTALRNNQSSSGYHEIHIAADNSQILGNQTPVLWDSVGIYEETGFVDNEYWGNRVGTRTLNGDRWLWNGYGVNSGDPSSTGVWNGNGREGIVIYDTSVSRPYTEYQYIQGAWQSA